MKTTILFFPLAAAMLLAQDRLSAQTPTLEFATGQGPTGSGPSIAAQTVTFENNTNNPTGNTFAAFTTPTTTATFSLSNQQYTLSTTESTTTAALVFGGGNNQGKLYINGYTYYNLMGNYSSPVNGDFTSAATVTAGTGIDITANYSLQLFTSVMGLYHAGSSTSGSYYIADLTITFSSYVTNPVLHFVGLGATYGSLGYSTELVLESPTTVTLSKLSGSTELSVSGGTEILNSATTIGGTTGSGAASGSVLVTGTNLTSLTFKVYVRGDGGGSSWSSGTTQSGDGWMIGVSTLTSSVTVLPLTITNFTATASNTSARLQWNTAADAGIRLFDIESSRDATIWQQIGTVPATDYNGLAAAYSYTDTHAAAGNNYYRIREADAGGNTVYSPIKSVYIGADASTKWQLFPNPVRDNLSITGSSPLQSVVILNADGKEMARYSNPGSGSSIDMHSLPGGTYFVTVRYASGQEQTRQVVKY